MKNIRVILKNFGANSFSVLINIVFQVVTIPIFIKYWGVDMYGEWLILTAAAAYFSMTDIGLSTATSNDFSINYVQNKYDKCNSLLNNNFYFIVVAFSIIFFGLFFTLVNFNLSAFFHFKIISRRNTSIALVLLTGQIFFGMLGNLYFAIYKATQHYARCLMIDNILRIVERLALIGGIILRLSFITILVLYVTPRILGFFIKLFDSRKYYKLNLSIKYLNKTEFKGIIIPSLSFLSFPIGNSIVLQGFTLLVGFVYGSVAVVLYNTTRTLVNFAKIGLGLIGNSFWPEYSLAYGKKDFGLMKKMHRYSVSSSLYLSILLAFFLFLFGKTIYMPWTNYKMDFNSVLFYNFLFTMVLSTIWGVSSVVLAATNNHKMYSLLYLISTIISLGVAYAILKTAGNISFLPLALLVTDILLIVVVEKQVLNLVSDTLREFIKSIILTPVLIVKSRLK